MQELLRVMQYPYPGDVRGNKVQLLDFLVSTLQACRILSAEEDNMAIDLPDIPPEIATLCKYLKELCEDLQIPFDVHAAVETLDAVKTKIIELLKTLPLDYISSPIFSKKDFSQQQLKNIEEVNEALREEYVYRFTVLKKRLDVTLQSFLWSDAGKKHELAIRNVIGEKIGQIPTEPDITVHDLFCAHADLGVISKTSSLSSQSPSVVKSVVVGSVPDRGGRPGEPHQAQMPNFKARDQSQQPQPQRQGRRGRVQARWQASGGGRGGKRKESQLDDKVADNNNNNNNNNMDVDDNNNNNQGRKEKGWKKGGGKSKRGG